MPDLFIDVPIMTDELRLYQYGLSKIQEKYPNWTPRPGGSIDLILRICASMAAVANENASSVGLDIFKTFGLLVKNPPREATQATVDATFTVRDTAGYIIPAFTPVGIRSSASADPEGFQTMIDLEVTAGTTTATIQLVAIDAGAQGSNLSIVTRGDSLGYVTDVSITGPTSGGQDEEDTQDYVDRLAREFELWTTTPITGPNFALKAQQVPGVYRAAAIENLNPADGTTNNEKYVAVCPIDINGNDLSSGTMAAVQTYLESLRELNFVAPVVAPNRTIVDVTYTAHVPSAADQQYMKDQIYAALAAFLNPGTWGMPRPFGRPMPIWYSNNKVRLYKIVQMIENVADVDWSEPVTIGVHGGALGTADITMSGNFPLPQLGTVTPTLVTT